MCDLLVQFNFMKFSILFYGLFYGLLGYKFEPRVRRKFKPRVGANLSLGFYKFILGW